MLEFGYRYKDRYALQENDDLADQLRKNFNNAVDFAGRIERQAAQLRSGRTR